MPIISWIEKKMEKIAGFSTVKVELRKSKDATPPNHFTAKMFKTFSHSMYIKINQDKNNAKRFPQNRTIFLIHPFPCATKKMFVKALKSFVFRDCGGTIERIEINYGKIDPVILSDSVLEEDVEIDTEKSAGMISPDTTIHIVFDSDAAANNAMGIRKVKIPIDLLYDHHSVVDAWKKIYNNSHPPIETLQQEADAAMMQFDKQNQLKLDEMQSKTNVVDEDGWVTVTRVGRRKTNTDGKVTVTAARKEDIARLKPKDKTVPNFYRFQQQEKKLDKLEELRRKFEDDKKRIAALKSTRKFKPY